MKKFLLTSAFLFLVTPAAHAQEAAPVSAPEQQAHWSYSGAHGAAHWDGLCASGEKQSPINIVRYLQEDVPDLGIEYHSGPLAVEHTGRSVQVNVESGSHIAIDGSAYELKYISFHTPSEHYLDGAPYPMEVHLMHESEDGRMAAIGVMVKVGAHNPLVEGVWHNVPAAGEVKKVELVQVNPAQLLPDSKAVYRYEGSLTSPPCTEGVIWNVMQEPIEISEAQLRAFQSVFPVNARPVQPRNERVITGD